MVHFTHMQKLNRTFSVYGCSCCCVGKVTDGHVADGLCPDCMSTERDAIDN